MRYSLAVIGSIGLLWAHSALAGPLDTPLPSNPCPLSEDMKIALVANEVGTDFGGSACGSGGGCAEAIIVCTNVGASDDGPIDLGVEMFAATGAPVANLFANGNAVECALAPGATVAFVTNGTMELPFFGQAMAGGPLVPMGSLRVVSTVPKHVACDVTLIDRTNVMTSGSTTAIKNVTVTRASKPQKGD